MLLPLNWRLAAPELRYQLDDAEPAVCFVEDEYATFAEATGWTFEPLAPPDGPTSRSPSTWPTTTGCS